MTTISAEIKLKNGTSISYNDQTKEVGYNGKTLTFGATNACKLFEMLLYNKDVITETQSINKMLNDESGTRAANEINKLKTMFKRRLGVPDDINIIENIKLRGYRLAGSINLINIPDKLAEHYRAVQVIESIGYENVASLMTELVNVYPLLSEFFFKTDTGQYLPFYKLPITPKFPMKVDNTITSVLPLRPDPLYQQRRSLGKKIYPGLIYRLTNISADNGWQLARTNYIHLIESCDYLQARIFSGWGETVTKDPSDVVAKQSFLKNSPYVKEWLSKVESILKGDFSTYVAGIAFNTPIFSKTPTGKLNLLLAEGSQLKQAAGGKLHVCPAGMLEFSNCDQGLEELSLEAFQTYSAKECLEETMRYNINCRAERIIRNFDNTEEEQGDFLSVRSIRGLIEDELLKEISAEASTSVLKQCLFMSPATQPFFAICDAFVLRPEIIVPLYINDEPEIVTNWENEKISEVTFSNVNDINELANNVHNWAAPGIAAAYLGASYWLKSSL